MNKNKIIPLVRNFAPIIDGEFSKYTATVLVPISPLELSVRSSDKLKLLLTKLLIKPKNYLLNIERDKIIDKDGSILNLNLERNFSVVQSGNHFIRLISDYHPCQINENENEILNEYIKNFKGIMPAKNQRSFYDYLLFEYKASINLNNFK